jgi:hypothetical protein
LNNIYYKIKWFCKVVLDSNNKRIMQLFFDKNNMEIIHFGVKIMVCDKKV